MVGFDFEKKNKTRIFSNLDPIGQLAKDGNWFVTKEKNNFEINEEFVWISFNEPVLYKHEYKKDRFLGIDLNPNWIAFSIMDKGEKEIRLG